MTGYTFTDSQGGACSQHTPFLGLRFFPRRTWEGKAVALQQMCGSSHGTPSTASSLPHCEASVAAPSLSAV